MRLRLCLSCRKMRRVGRRADMQAESFSMHGPIYGHLMNGCLGLLNRLGQDVAQKRDEFMPQVGYVVHSAQSEALIFNTDTQRTTVQNPRSRDIQRYQTLPIPRGSRQSRRASFPPDAEPCTPWVQRCRAVRVHVQPSSSCSTWPYTCS